MNLGPEIQCNEPALDIVGNSLKVGDLVAISPASRSEIVIVRKIDEIKWYREWNFVKDTTVPPDRYGHQPIIRVFNGEPYAMLKVGRMYRRSNKVAKVATK